MSSDTVLIGEAAKRTSLSVDTIRFYERRGLLPKPRRTTGRFRLYTSEDVERLGSIRRMQSLGFSLKEIQRWLDLSKREVDACPSVRELLETKLKAIRVKMNDLRNLELKLSADLRQCERELKNRSDGHPKPCPVLRTRISALSPEKARLSRRS
jgi:MerR family mercuric resistance operon transcriptional regulator